MFPEINSFLSLQNFFASNPNTYLILPQSSYTVYCFNRDIHDIYSNKAIDSFVQSAMSYGGYLDIRVYSGIKNELYTSLTLWDDNMYRLKILEMIYKWKKGEL